jgi:hypothetical protein
MLEIAKKANEDANDYCEHHTSRTCLWYDMVVGTCELPRCEYYATAKDNIIQTQIRYVSGSCMLAEINAA